MTRAPTATRSDGHVRWPAARFYWSELDASALGRRPSRRELGYLLESDLPVPLESVHAVFAPLARGPDGEAVARRYVGCAVAHERLRAELPEGAVSLRPAAPPEFLAGRCDCAALELLRGRWEPPRVRRLRRGCVGAAMAALALCLGAVSLGIQRRAAMERSAAAAAESLRRDMLFAALGEAGHRPNADMLLASELSRLRATRRGPASGALSGTDRDGVDAGTILAGVLAVWPPDVHLRTESLAVAGDQVVVAGTVPVSADAQRVADAIGRFAAEPVDGTGRRWRLEQPRFESLRDGVSVTIRIRRGEQAP